MKILVTGAGGFVGKHLVNKLVKQGNQVRALVKENTSLKGVEVIVGNLSDVDILEDAVDGVDIVYHLAASLGRHKVSNKEMYDTNVNGTLNLVKCLEKQKLIFISSGGILGPGININESKEPDPRSYYEKTKLIAENEIKKNYDNYVIIRPSLVYGPGDMFLLKIFKAIKNKRYPLIGNGKNLINLVYVEDLVDFLIKCADKKGIYIAASDNVTIKEFSELIASKLNVKLIKIKIPKFLALIAANINDILRLGLPLTKSSYKFFTENRAFDNSEAIKIGFKSTSLDNGLNNTIKWYKDNNLL